MLWVIAEVAILLLATPLGEIACAALAGLWRWYLTALRYVLNCHGGAKDAP